MAQPFRYFRVLQESSILPDEALVCSRGDVKRQATSQEVKSAIDALGGQEDEPIGDDWNRLSHHVRDEILMASFRCQLNKLDESVPYLVTATRGDETITYGLKRADAVRHLMTTLDESWSLSLATRTVAECPYDDEDEERPDGPEVDEDAAANAAGFGNVAGLGVGPQGEPPAPLARPANKRRRDGSIDPRDPNMGLITRKDPTLVTEMETDANPLTTEDEDEPQADPLVEGVTGVTRMQVQNAYDRYLSVGNSPTMAVHYAEKELGVRWIMLSADRRTVVNFVDPNNPIGDDSLDESADPDVFAGQTVFDLDSDKYHQCRMGKNRYHRYEMYVGNDEIGEAIRKFGRENRNKPIIVRNRETGSMMFLRYGGKTTNRHRFNPHQS